MLPARRLRAILARGLHGVPGVRSPVLEPGTDLHDYLLKTYMQETKVNEELTDFFVSVSFLGIASHEDWLRLKKIFFDHISSLSCRTVNRIFALLVENNACGRLECVRIQNLLAKLDFSNSLRYHECLETLRNITNIGSRLSPEFIPKFLEIVPKLVKDSQTEALPTLSYVLGKILTSNENKSIPSEVRYSILNALFKRVESIDCMLLSQSEVVYLVWSLSAFCSSIVEIRPMFVSVSEILIMRGIHINEIKEANPRDLLLIISSLCPLISLSGVKNLLLPTKEDGLILPVTTEIFDSDVISKPFLRELVIKLDAVLSIFLQRISYGEIQNNISLLVVLEMITSSGATKLLKNAQVLLHLLIRNFLYEGYDVWFSIPRKCTVTSEGDLQQPLINFFAFDKEIGFLDLITTRLSVSILPSLSLRGLGKASIQEVIAVLEALVYGNISELMKKLYLEACIVKLPRFIRSTLQHDLSRIVDAVVKLGIDDPAINRTIQDRSQELGLKYQMISNERVNKNEGVHEHLKSYWGADVITLCVCEKALNFLGKNKNSKNELPELLKILNVQKGINSANETHCISIIRSLSKCHLPFREDDLYRTLVKSLFSRVGMINPLHVMLSLILDGIRIGISRDVLLDSLYWVGSKLAEKDLLTIEPIDVANYFIVAHELDVLNTVVHPCFIAVLRQENALNSFSSHIAGRLFAALCSFGIDDKELLEKLLKQVMPWSLQVTTQVEWLEKDWKTALTLVHALWSLSSEIVREPLLVIARILVPVMLQQNINDKTQKYSLFVAMTASTLLIIDDPSSISKEVVPKNSQIKILEDFLTLLVSLFSEDGMSLSLVRTSALLNSETMFSIVPRECSNIICFLVIAHTVQRLAQTENGLSKRFTPLGVSLWRYSLKYIEKTPIADDVLMTAVGFSIRFGASSQAFDRFMSTIMEKDIVVSMLTVCSVAYGLVRTGKRRSVATQFVAYFSQRNCLDDLPATALLYLLLFFTRDAEQVALGLTRSDMLVALVWSSLSLKIDRLPCTKELWKLIDSVPLVSAPSLLRLINEKGLIDKSSEMELLKPISSLLAWEPNAACGDAVTDFLRKVKISLENRLGDETALKTNAREIQKMISDRIH
ncbi:uncharacterized protein TM35_000131890 [Trypanosoma theileri]|uniref:Uncharacterized protein n=1 Tax=Trypanosoma theileri TaxID=67003 RepID=A0A1X0NWW4_9TRYP|nr:uncharacterized protein TM35_000131890 [Trypanosoma theileri]ORC89185.1 hypothetical protein TM35_000131890 [Trypanosoma theileri]